MVGSSFIRKEGKFVEMTCHLLSLVTTCCITRCHSLYRSRSSHQRWSVTKCVLRNFAKFTGKHLCHSLFFKKETPAHILQLIKKETLAQVLSCEFCEISKNTFCYRIPLVAASSTRCRLLSFIVPLVAIRFHLMYLTRLSFYKRSVVRTNPN